MDLSKQGNTSRPVDHAFTKASPKIELHAHLSGSITRTCLHEIWLRKKAQDPQFQIEDPWVLMPPGKVDYDLQTFFQVFTKSIYQLCNDLESLRYATNSVLADFHADGVRYLELRTTPREIPERGISKEEYVLTVLESIDRFKKQQQQQQRQQRRQDSNEDEDDDGDDKMAIYLILSIDRGNHTAEQAMEIVDLALKYKSQQGTCIVGIDLCGNPTRGDISIYDAAFSLAKAQGLKITLHFGETPFSGSITELSTLLSFQPDRLGHVIHVPDPIREEIARRKLGLELCMSCNVHAKMMEGGAGFADHHFGYYYRGGDCPIALCTDDVGFFCSPVSNEYLLAAEHFHLSRADLLDLCYRAVDSIFGGGSDEKDRLRRLLKCFAARERVKSTRV